MVKDAICFKLEISTLENTTLAKHKVMGSTVGKMGMFTRDNLMME